MASPPKSPPKSPSKGKRFSTSNINPEFQQMALSRSLSFNRKLNLKQSLGKAFTVKPPGTLGHSLKAGPPRFFTVRMNDALREMVFTTNPDEHYEQIVKSLDAIQEIQRGNYTAQVDYINIIEEQMLEAIFGSNAIEMVGGSIKITYRLCRNVFSGNLPDIGKIDEQDDTYTAEIATLANTGRGTDNLSIIRSRREIVQHALAMKYIIDMIVVKDALLDEAIVKKTHRLLMEHSDHEDIGGVYRTSDEAASHGMRLETDKEYNARVQITRKLKPNRPPPERMSKPLFFSKFVRGGSVPLFMSELVRDINREIQLAEEIGEIDPIDIATKLCNAFVCIHPFEDGNGRVCRLLMNAVLLKYTGTVVEIGAEPEEREKYLEQAYYANKEFTKEDQEDIPWERRISHKNLAAVVVQKLTVRLKDVMEKLGSN
jgi:hypothetical protein